MKNNIRYKGDTNNTSVIIFSKSKVKNSQRCYLAWENLRGGFCNVSCCSSFQFWSSFCCCIFISFLVFILLFFFICWCSSFTFSFRHHPSPFCGLSPGFYTHFILSSQLIVEWFAAGSFSTIPLSSYRALQFWVGIFYPQAFFTLRSFNDILTCVYQGFPGNRHFFLEVCRASYWSSKDTPGPSVCLIYSNPQSLYPITPFLSQWA